MTLPQLTVASSQGSGTGSLRLGGRRPQAVKAPERYETGRVCARRSCNTQLTTYNKHDVCFAHTPPRFPRGAAT